MERSRRAAAGAGGGPRVTTPPSDCCREEIGTELVTQCWQETDRQTSAPSNAFKQTLTRATQSDTCIRTSRRSRACAGAGIVIVDEKRRMSPREGAIPPLTSVSTRRERR